MTIIAGIIGMGIGAKHLDAIEKYKESFVKTICEKDNKKIKYLKKRYPNIKITSNENEIFYDKSINLVSIASYDNYHYRQIVKGLNNKKNLIVEKPLCLKFNELKKIDFLLKKNKRIKITSNLVLRVNSLFNYFKRNINVKDIFYIEGDYIWGRKEKLFGWRSKIKEYSLILGAGIHIIDLVMWLTGLRPKFVSVYNNKKCTSNTKFKKDSLNLMIFEFPNNILVNISANGAAVHDHFHELKIFTKSKTFTNTKQGAYLYKKNKIEKINVDYPDKKNRKKLIHNFLDIILKKKVKPIINHSQLIDLMSVCMSAVKASKINKKIKIKYLKR